MSEPFLRAPRASLSRALSAVAKLAATNRTSVPGHRAALLDIESGMARISGSNGDMTASFDVAGETSPGTLAVDARRLAEIVAALPAGEVELRGAGAHLLAKGPRAEYRIDGLPVADFPGLRTSGDQSSIYAIEASDLRRGLQSVAWTLADDATQPARCCAVFSFREDGLLLSGTDTYRIALCKLGRTDDAGREVLMLYREHAELLLSFLPEAGEVTLLPEAHQFGVSWEGGYANSAVVAGQPYDCEKLASRFEASYGAYVDREGLSRACGRLMLVADPDKMYRASYAFCGGSLSVGAASHGQGNEEIPAECANGDDPMDWAFDLSAQYLRQALGVLEGDRVLLEWNGARAIRLTAEESPGTILMLNTME